ncbi:hypothetical protein WDZ92_01715, partial [Nostoc sp. NIES-2111]
STQLILRMSSPPHPPPPMQPISIKADATPRALLMERATQAGVTLSAYCAWALSQFLNLPADSATPETAAPAKPSTVPSSAPSASPQLLQIMADIQESKEVLATLAEMVSDRVPTNLTYLCNLAEDHMEGLTLELTDEQIAEAKKAMLEKILTDGNILLFTSELPGGAQISKAFMAALADKKGTSVVEALADIIHTAHDRTGTFGGGERYFSDEAAKEAAAAYKEAKEWDKANPAGQVWKGAEAYCM